MTFFHDIYLLAPTLIQRLISIKNRHLNSWRVGEFTLNMNIKFKELEIWTVYREQMKSMGRGIFVILSSVEV